MLTAQNHSPETLSAGRAFCSNNVPLLHGRTILPAAPPESGRGLSGLLRTPSDWSAPGDMMPAAGCRGEETGASPRQLRLRPTAVALAPRTHVELQREVEIVGR